MLVNQNPAKLVTHFSQTEIYRNIHGITHGKSMKGK